MVVIKQLVCVIVLMLVSRATGTCGYIYCHTGDTYATMFLLAHMGPPGYICTSTLVYVLRPAHNWKMCCWKFAVVQYNLHTQMADSHIHYTNGGIIHQNIYIQIHLQQNYSLNSPVDCRDWCTYPYERKSIHIYRGRAAAARQGAGPATARGGDDDARGSGGSSPPLPSHLRSGQERAVAARRGNSMARLTMLLTSITELEISLVSTLKLLQLNFPSFSLHPLRHGNSNHACIHVLMEIMEYSPTCVLTQVATSKRRWVNLGHNYSFFSLLPSTDRQQWKRDKNWCQLVTKWMSFCDILVFSLRFCSMHISPCITCNTVLRMHFFF